ncbi:MAG: PKD-like family lipoprotein [Butyricimonas virosa]|nr:PKD-like family lipoprotein [Butyricimonas virosa]
MKIIYITFLFLVTFNFICCYDDKGNYEYKQINDIEISFPDYNFEQVIGETFKLYPKFTYKYKDTANLNLSYKWAIGERVIGENRQLVWQVDTNEQVEIALYVTNIDDNMVYMGSTIVRPTSIYTWYNSYLVLSEKNGKSILSFVRYDEKENASGETIYDEFDRPVLVNQVYEDIYYNENKDELGSKPLFIQEHIAKIFPSEGHVIVFQEGGQGSVDLDGTSMKKDILLVESFSKGSYPADFHPTNAEMMTYTHLIENHDGKIYSKIKESYKLFQSGYYIHTPLMLENKEIRAHIINSVLANDKPYTLLHSIGTTENPENRLLLVHDLQYSFTDVNVSGKVVALPEPTKGWPENFRPLTDLGNCQVINISQYNTGNTKKPGYTMFLKNSDGSYQYQAFELEREYSGEKLSYPKKTIAGKEQEMLISFPITSPIPLEECVFCNIASRQNEYIFIAYGKDIYFLDRTSPENGIRHYYTCKANVVDMDGREYYGEQLFVGLDNGGVLLLNSNNAKNITTNAEKFRWESGPEVDLGKIVDVTLKVGGNVP